MTERQGNSFLRTARKPWECAAESAHRRGREWAKILPDGHMAVIPPGARYVEDVDNVPLYQSGYRYCIACAIEFAGWKP